MLMLYRILWHAVYILLFYLFFTPRRHALFLLLYISALFSSPYNCFHSCCYACILACLISHAAVYHPLFYQYMPHHILSATILLYMALFCHFSPYLSLACGDRQDITGGRMGCLAGERENRAREREREEERKNIRE